MPLAVFPGLFRIRVGTQLGNRAVSIEWQLAWGSGRRRSGAGSRCFPYSPRRHVPLRHQRNYPGSL